MAPSLDEFPASRAGARGGIRAAVSLVDASYFLPPLLLSSLEAGGRVLFILLFLVGASVPIGTLRSVGGWDINRSVTPVLLS